MRKSLVFVTMFKSSFQKLFPKITFDPEPLLKIMFFLLFFPKSLQNAKKIKIKITKNKMQIDAKKCSERKSVKIRAQNANKFFPSNSQP